MNCVFYLGSRQVSGFGVLTLDGAEVATEESEPPTTEEAPLALSSMAMEFPQ